MADEYITRDEYEGDQKVIDERFSRDFERLKALEANQEALMDLTFSVRDLTKDQGYLRGDVGEIKKDVKSIMEKPGKRWDTLIEKVFWAIVGAWVMYALKQIGL